MPTLVLTLDYELFGDGSGNVVDDVVRPTDRLLRVAERYRVPLTFFWEIVEHWRLDETYRAGESMGYPVNPAGLMTDQLVAAVRGGHDVQLHVHPQWLRARYAAGRWRVDEKHWRLPSLPDEPGGELPTIAELLARGKRAIEAQLRPFDAAYRCRAFRAGSYNVQPADRVVPALRAAGLEADTSVVPGGFADTPRYRFDYRGVEPTQRYWRTTDDDVVARGGPGEGVLELPVFALPMRRFRKLDLHRLRSKLGSKTGARASYGQVRSRLARSGILRYLLETEAVPWDFCLGSLETLKRFWRHAQRLEAASGLCDLPFVLIGHNKDLARTRDLERFLDFLLDRPAPPRFATVGSTLDRLQPAAPAAVHG